MGTKKSKSANLAKNREPASTSSVTRGGGLEYGTVLAATASLQSYRVQLVSGKTITCALSSLMIGLIGVKDARALPSGITVLVVVSTDSAATGLIIAVAPSAAVKGVTQHSLSINRELGSDMRHELGVATRAGTQAAANNRAHRPYDSLPGQLAFMTEEGAYLGLLGMIAEIRGSAGAGISFNAIDDFCRLLTVGAFDHELPTGTRRVFTDNGRLTDEEGITPHQEELYGEDKLGAAFDQTTYQPTDHEFCHEVNIKDNKLKRSFHRLRKVQGHLADLRQVYYASPKKEGDKLKPVGRGFEGVSSDGVYSMEMAGGVYITAREFIPVPDRLLDYDDPEGDHGEAIKDDDKKPFEHNASFPFARHLELEDKKVWLRRNRYARFDKRKKDFHVPQDADLAPNPEDVDTIDKVTAERRSEPRRCAGVYEEPDGTLILRDGWGSELVMSGGNITVSCAGNLFLTGGSGVIMHGNRLSLKSQETAELVSSSGDIKIKSERNTHVYSHKAGVVLQSDATGVGVHGFQDGPDGDTDQSQGIILKSKGQVVALGDRRVHLISDESLLLDAGEKGSVITVARQVLTAAKTNVVTLTPRAAYLQTGNSSILAGNTTMMLASRQAVVTEGVKIWTPEKADLEENIGEKLLNDLKPTYKQLYEDMEAWQGEFSKDKRVKIKFRFRSSKSYGVSPGKPFIYQSFWQYCQLAGSKLVPGSSKPWVEPEVNNTKPWPGKEAASALGYVTLSKETNLNTATRVEVSRDEAKNKSAELQAKTFDKFTVTRG